MFLSIWPKPQKYKFNKRKTQFSKKRVEYIEKFFAHKYNSKYSILTTSARVGIILTLKFKKFTRSRILEIPKWSSHCLYSSIGSITNISCDDKNADGSLIVHHLGNSHSKQKTKNFLIDDSSDSIPTNKFKACFNSKLSEVISLPKIIGSFCGGIILTNNKLFYNYLKEFQSKNQKFASIQSMKKYTCLILNKKNFEWHYNESFNHGLDYNTTENVYENLKNFEKNKNIILNRKNFLTNNKINFDKYRIGPCLLLDFNKKLVNLLETIHTNKLASSDEFKFVKKYVLPIHFTISDKNLEKKINEIKRN